MYKQKMEPTSLAALITSVIVAVGVLAEKILGKIKHFKARSPCCDVSLSRTTSCTPPPKLPTPRNSDEVLEARISEIELRQAVASW